MLCSGRGSCGMRSGEGSCVVVEEGYVRQMVKGLCGG